MATPSISRKQSVYVTDNLLALCGASTVAEMRAMRGLNFSGRLNAVAARYQEMCRRALPTLPAACWDAIVGLLDRCDPDVLDPRMLPVLAEDAVGLDLKDAKALATTLEAQDYAGLCAVLEEGLRRQRARDLQSYE